MPIHIYQSIDTGLVYIPPTAGSTDGEMVTELSTSSPRIRLSQLRNSWTAPIPLALRASTYDEYLMRVSVQGDHADLVQLSYDGVNWISGQLTYRMSPEGYGVIAIYGGLWFSWIRQVNTLFWIRGYIGDYFGNNFDDNCFLQLNYMTRV